MQKIIRDKYGDTATVTTEGRSVDLRSSDGLLILSPKQARKVAKALRKAARKIEASRVLSDIDRAFD